MGYNVIGDNAMTQWLQLRQPSMMLYGEWFLMWVPVPPLLWMTTIIPAHPYPSSTGGGGEPLSEKIDVGCWILWLYPPWIIVVSLIYLFCCCPRHILGLMRILPFWAWFWCLWSLSCSHDVIDWLLSENGKPILQISCLLVLCLHHYLWVLVPVNTMTHMEHYCVYTRKFQHELTFVFGWPTAISIVLTWRPNNFWNIVVSIFAIKMFSLAEFCYKILATIVQGYWGEHSVIFSQLILHRLISHS